MRPKTLTIARDCLAGSGELGIYWVFEGTPELEWKKEPGSVYLIPGPKGDYHTSLTSFCSDMWGRAFPDLIIDHIHKTHIIKVELVSTQEVEQDDNPNES